MIRISSVDEVMVFYELEIDQSFFLKENTAKFYIDRDLANLYDITFYNADKIIQFSISTIDPLFLELSRSHFYLRDPSIDMLEYMCRAPVLRRHIKHYCLFNKLSFDVKDHSLLAASIFGDNDVC